MRHCLCCAGRRREFADENDDLLDLLDMSDDVDEDFPYDQDDLIVKQDQANHLLESGRLDEAIEMLEQMIVEYQSFGQRIIISLWPIFILAKSIRQRNVEPGPS